MTCSNWSWLRSYRKVFVLDVAGVPVAGSTFTHLPVSVPLPSRLRSCTVAYAEDGTADALSFWSVRPSFPVDCTGFTSNTRAVPVLPVLGFGAAWAGATPTARQPASASAPTGSRRDMGRCDIGPPEVAEPTLTVRTDSLHVGIRCRGPVAS